MKFLHFGIELIDGIFLSDVPYTIFNEIVMRNKTLKIVMRKKSGVINLNKFHYQQPQNLYLKQCLIFKTKARMHCQQIEQ